jgi:hypothetical protein
MSWIWVNCHAYDFSKPNCITYSDSFTDINSDLITSSNNFTDTNCDGDINSNSAPNDLSIPDVDSLGKRLTNRFAITNNQRFAFSLTIVVAISVTYSTANIDCNSNIGTTPFCTSICGSDSPNRFT